MQGAPGGALQAALSTLSASPNPRRDSNATGGTSPTSNAITAGFGGGGGGLASSPNVPAPGTSIDPATGKPHTAGLTRAELEAMKAKGQGLLDPVPTSSEIRRASSIKLSFQTADLSTGDSGGTLPRRLSQLTGREQAAAQLTGNPGLASPTSPGRKGSVVDDIEKNVTRLGQRAYEAVPPAIKDIFAEPKGKGVEGSPVKARRGSAAALIDNVKVQANRLSTTVQNALNDPNNASSSPLATAAIGTQPVQPVAVAVPVVPVTDTRAPAAVAAEPRRPSVFENIQVQAKKISQDVQHQLQEVQQQLDYGRSESGLKTGSGATSTTSTEPSLLSSAKDNIQLQARRLSQTVQNQLDYGRSDSALKTGPGAASTEPGIFSDIKENVQLQARRLSQTLQNQVEHGRTDSAPKAGPAATTSSGEPGVFAQVKDFIQSAYSSATEPVTPTASTVTAAKTTSLPSQENQGTRPGEVSAGAGALPGKLGEAGVAVPPDVRAAEGTAGGLITTSPAGAIAAGTGLTAGAVVAELFSTNKGPDAASGPDQDKIASNLKKPDPATASSDPHVIAADLNRSIDLPAALPQIDLGLGAAHGATNLDAVGVSNSSSTAPSTTGTAVSRSPNDRTDSLTSVTAIRHGHAGDREHPIEPSPLAAGAIDENKSTATTGQESTTRGTGPNHTTSLAPGKEEHGVGHPSTRDHEGTSRVPGAYPAAQHDQSDSHKTASATGTSTSTPPTSTAVKADDVNKSVAKGDLDVKPAPFAPGGIAGAGAGGTTAAHESSSNSLGHGSGTGTGNGNGSSGSAMDHVKSTDGHRRSSSSASGSGKKVGFMQKLKGEMKVISGKISHDEEKVELGEKLKHGEA